MKDNSKAARERRKAGAVEREAARASRTPSEQLEALVKRPGQSKREAKRLFHEVDRAAAMDRHPAGKGKRVTAIV